MFTIWLILSPIWQQDDIDCQTAIGLNEILDNLQSPDVGVVPAGIEAVVANCQGNSMLLHIQAGFGNANEMAD